MQATLHAPFGLDTVTSVATQPPPLSYTRHLVQHTGGYGGCEDYAFVNTLAALDITTGAVTQLTPSGPPPAPRAYHSWATLGRFAYVFGGRNLGGLVSEGDPTLLCAYDIQEVGCEATTTVSICYRGCATAALRAGDVLYCAAVLSLMTALQRAVLYALELAERKASPLPRPAATQNAWLPLAAGAGARGAAPRPRSSHRAVAFEGRMVLFGGTDQAKNSEDLTRVYT